MHRMLLLPLIVLQRYVSNRIEVMKVNTRVIKAIDSHTAGEPTRVIVEGGPDLGDGPLNERLQLFRTQYDAVRSATVNEPRGSDVLVGALLTPPVNPASAAGIIFFNNAGYLGMCGHGAIGVVATLKHLGKITAGSHVLETPVGNVVATCGTAFTREQACLLKRYVRRLNLMFDGDDAGRKALQKALYEYATETGVLRPPATTGGTR